MASRKEIVLSQFTRWRSYESLSDNTYPGAPLSPVHARTESKQQLQPELDLPRGRRCRGNLPGRVVRRGAKAVARENNGIGGREVVVIENIEDLRPELQSPMFAKSKSLEE